MQKTERTREILTRGDRTAAKRLELPSFDEGFAELYFVKIDPETSRFIVEKRGDIHEDDSSPKGV